MAETGNNDHILRIFECFHHGLIVLLLPIITFFFNVFIMVLLYCYYPLFLFSGMGKKCQQCRCTGCALTVGDPRVHPELVLVQVPVHMAAISDEAGLACAIERHSQREDALRLSLGTARMVLAATQATTAAVTKTASSKG